MKYNAKNRQKINDNAKEAYKKKKELKKKRHTTELELHFTRIVSNILAKNQEDR